ncbi:MAG TPA: YcxB family protein [Caproiciproducens sp.]|nr:YcxB family protein [Caproiciproducens sp.]
MPTFYEGSPIAIIEQTVSESEWGGAFYTAQSMLFPIRRREVKAGICVTAAVLIGSVIPVYRFRFSTVVGPVCGILFALALAAAFYFVQPNEIRRWGQTLYRSNALLSLPEKIMVYRDSVVIENQHEKILEYWTDFAKCIETKDAFVITGGLERNLLTIRKSGLPKEQVAALSAHFANTFAARYEKTGR